MSMRDMIQHMRPGPSVVSEHKSLLDTHAKLHGTPDALPDRPMTWQEHSPTKDFDGMPQSVTGWGHREEIKNLHPAIAKHLPDATHATVLYDPTRYLLHNGSKTVHVHADEPDFNHVVHHLEHTLHKFDLPRGQFDHLHTDTLKQTHYKRAPEESAQQFSNRIANGISHDTHFSYNEMYEAEHEHPHGDTMLMDPLEEWAHGADKEKHEKVLIGREGGVTHHPNQIVDGEPGGDYRHGHVQQEFTHSIEVK